jgi:hypothetical protein
MPEHTPEEVRRNRIGCWTVVGLFVLIAVVASFGSGGGGSSSSGGGSGTNTAVDSQKLASDARDALSTAGTLDPLDLTP